MNAIEKDRKYRYKSITLFANALEEYLEKYNIPFEKDTINIKITEKNIKTTKTHFNRKKLLKNISIILILSMIITISIFYSIQLKEVQCFIGEMYYNGKIVDKNLQKAFYWYKKASNQNYAKAQYQLSILYRDGQGVERNIQKAVDLLKKSANLGHAGALYLLAIMYYNGHGVEKNADKAFELLKKSANEKLALKMLRIQDADSVTIHRFEREIQACNELSHPNIVKIHDWGIYKKNPYMIMDYITGIPI